MGITLAAAAEQTTVSQASVRIDWESVFPDKGAVRDINQLGQPIPFCADYDQNVADTLEWLIRHVKQWDRYNQEEPFARAIRDGWFHNEDHEGFFYHVCDGPALLKFRQQYEAAYRYLKESWALEEGRDAHEKAVALKISMWGVIGRDGYLDYMLSEEGEDYELKMVENTRVYKFLRSGIGYRYMCSKCGAEMPKAIRAWVMLNCVGGAS